MTNSNLTAGWARPLNSRKHHFFKEGEAVSICGKWMLVNPVREPDTFESPDDCLACRRKLTKEQAK
ncbi:MAG TPA: hypothetical protein VGL07_17810 [Buttiauxella sp.]|jgi:hypothetical protein